LASATRETYKVEEAAADLLGSAAPRSPLGCSSPASVGCDGRHGAIASPTHLWESRTGGEIDWGVWLAPPDSAMEFDSKAMPNTPYISCYFNGPFLLACPRVL
jgi:hypothetical protein